MAKPIMLTEEIRLQCLQEFAQKLADARMAGGTFEFKKDIKYEGKRECEVVYTPEAWYKTLMLIQENAKEVGWHGICRRDEEDPAVFNVEDILVYPQKVTGTTINPDAVEYAAWMNQLDDDTFNNLRCHVHSHVNMGVTPSGTDQKFREDRLSQLGDDDFYVFQIMNKKGDISSAVYDFRENVFYETADVKTLVLWDGEMEEWSDYKIIGDLLLDGLNPENLCAIIELFNSSGMKEFIEGAKESVKEEKFSYGSFGNRSNSSYQSGVYVGKSTNGQKKTSEPPSKVLNNGPSSCYNGTTDNPIDDSFEDDAFDEDERLKDPFGYTDEKGMFHGNGSYLNFCEDGDCSRCTNTSCAWNERYYDHFGYGYYGGGWDC